MPDFPIPDWVASHFAGKRDQVSHCLNLALPLANPAIDLPCVLLDIAAAQPQIKQALVELNFLHFARFVPSRSGTHLMVTTEFDGPFEPYVLDFAVCIGDVFNQLLSHCKPHPQLPVGHHPDEFLAFVREWNRVPVSPAAPLLPVDFDYPVFSAYPQLTVLDIVGPRSALPAPVVDRPAAPVDLADVQGNLLKGYRAQFARHFVLAISDPAKARAWLAALPVTDARAWGPIKPASMLNIGFTFAGLQQLWPGRSKELERFPKSFLDGPALRAEANEDTGTSAPQGWRFGGSGPAAHAMLSVFAFEQVELDRRAAEIAGQLAANGLQPLHTQDARSTVDGTIPFGFRDGIAQPRIAGQCSERDDMQPAASPGEFLLGANYVGIYGGPSLGGLPADIAANGSFCAVRLMEQDVAGFESLLDEAVAKAANPATTRELVAAKLMGRWRDGTPVSLHPTDASWKASAGTGVDRNDFDYAPSYEYPGTPEDHFGARCPVGAHVRRTNPRSARIAGARHSRRLIRRGMPTAWDEGGKRREGLFGIFLCASLERQFEFILQQWINGDLAASGIRGTQDPIVGSGSMGGKIRLPGLAARGGDLELNVPRLTTTRGSLYLLMPGIAALRSLAPASPSAAAAPITEFAQELAAGSSGVVGSLIDAGSKVAESAAGVGAVVAAAFGGAATAAPAVLPPGTSAAIDAALAQALGGFQAMAERLRDVLYAPAVRPVGAPPPPVVPVDPTDPRFIADPYPTFDRLRRQAPVQFVAPHRAYWVTGRALVERLCREPALFRQKPLGTLLVGLLTLDEPRHVLVRGALDTAFSNALSSQPTIARQVIRQALTDLARLPHVDLVGGFARRIATENFMRFFGVPPDERDEIDRLARSVMMHADTTLDSVQQALGWKDGATLALRLGDLLVRAFFEAVARGGLPPSPMAASFRGNLLQEMALRTQWLPFLPGPMTILESVMTALQFTLAGYLSTEFLLATTCRNLLLPQGASAQRPWDVLVKNPSRLGDALDEARRFDSPLGVIERHAARDLAAGEFASFAIPKDALLLGFIGSANRDPFGWPAGTNLETFDVSRTQLPKSLLTFGDGIHRCIGQPLQEVVVPLAMQSLIGALPTLRLQSPAAVPPWIPNIYFRSFTALPATTCP